MISAISALSAVRHFAEMVSGLIKFHKRFQVSPLRLPGYAGHAAQPPAKTKSGLIKKRNYWRACSRVRWLWERFPTAMNSVMLSSEIAVNNHAHPPVTLPTNGASNKKLKRDSSEWSHRSNRKNGCCLAIMGGKEMSDKILVFGKDA